MKKILLIIVCVLNGMFINAQENLIITKTVECKGITKDKLYEKAQEWIVKTFKHSKNVVQLADKEIGKIMLKGTFDYNPPKFAGGGMGGVEGYIAFNMSINFKDDKFRYIITDFEHKPNNSPSCGILTNEEEPPFVKYRSSAKRAQVLWADMKKEATAQGIILGTTLEESISKNSQDENW